MESSDGASQQPRRRRILNDSGTAELREALAAMSAVATVAAASTGLAQSHVDTTASDADGAPQVVSTSVVPVSSPLIPAAPPRTASVAGDQSLACDGPCLTPPVRSILPEHEPLKRKFLAPAANEGSDRSSQVVRVSKIPRALKPAEPSALELELFAWRASLKAQRAAAIAPSTAPLATPQRDGSGGARSGGATTSSGAVSAADPETHALAMGRNLVSAGLLSGIYAGAARGLEPDSASEEDSILAGSEEDSAKFVTPRPSSPKAVPLPKPKPLRLADCLEEGPGDGDGDGGGEKPVVRVRKVPAVEDEGPWGAGSAHELAMWRAEVASGLSGVSMVCG